MSSELAYAVDGEAVEIGEIDGAMFEGRIGMRSLALGYKQGEVSCPEVLKSY
jgi:hypothetical protein